jgi:hypothetical protein
MATTRGFSATETAGAYAKATALAEQAGTGNSLHLLYGLSVAAITRAEFRSAIAINNEILKVARAVGTPDAMILAHTVLGNVCLFVGELTALETTSSRQAICTAGRIFTVFLTSRPFPALL